MSGNIIPIQFDDFKKLCNEHSKRVYYFQNEELLDLYFVSEGMFIWSYLDLSVITDKEQFFSQKMFIGATKLLFKIPVNYESSVPGKEPSVTLVDVQIAEDDMPSQDIQREGVDEARPTGA